MSKVVVFTNLTLDEEDHRRSHAVSVNSKLKLLVLANSFFAP